VNRVWLHDVISRESHPTPRLVSLVIVNWRKLIPFDSPFWCCLRILDNISTSMSTLRAIFVFATPVPRYEIFRRISYPERPTATTKAKAEMILIEFHRILSRASLIQPVKSNLFSSGQSTPRIGTRPSEQIKRRFLLTIIIRSPHVRRVFAGSSLI
jgi:hypothetical protein